MSSFGLVGMTILLWLSALVSSHFYYTLGYGTKTTIAAIASLLLLMMSIYYIDKHEIKELI